MTLIIIVWTLSVAVLQLLVKAVHRIFLCETLHTCDVMLKINMDLTCCLTQKPM